MWSYLTYNVLCKTKIGIDEEHVIVINFKLDMEIMKYYCYTRNICYNIRMLHMISKVYTWQNNIYIGCSEYANT